MLNKLLHLPSEAWIQVPCTLSWRLHFKPSCTTASQRVTDREQNKVKGQQEITLGPELGNFHSLLSKS